MTEPTSILHEVFGHPAFRPGQAEAVEALRAGSDVQVVLPTGGGKSLCYQVPAILAAREGRGPTLVVSPLIALMDNQVRALHARDVPAAALHSGLSWDAQRAQLTKLGSLALIYASPERLASTRFRALLARCGLAHVVVDEAHCISEWGHDFRPEYRKLAAIRETMPVPIMAATATATPAVLRDIADSLQLRSPVQVIGSFYRKNLTFTVEHIRGDAARSARALSILQSAGFSARQAPGRAIIYVSTRKRAQQVCRFLRKAALPAAYYHAGRSDTARVNAQRGFAEGRYSVLVATSAFGMGVDLPDIRHVIHAQAPGTIEAYYQQAGRAGRDGAPAGCTLLYSPADTRTFHRLVGKTALQGQRTGHRAILDYIFGSTCRQVSFADHFGVPLRVPCGSCDVCRDAQSVAEMVQLERDRSARTASARREKAAAERAVMLTAEQDEGIVAFVGGLKSPVSKRLVARGLRGSRAKAVLRKKLECNPRYGTLCAVPEESIVLAIERLLRTGHLVGKGRKYPTVWIPGRPVRGPARSARRPQATGLERDLKQMRRRLARRARIKPYQVFPDKTLKAIVETRPVSLETLGALWGMGDKRLTRYGTEILRLVASSPPPAPTSAR